MNYKQCIKHTAIYLCDERLKHACETPGASLLPDVAQKMTKLIDCVNLIINEIACEYYPLTKREKVVATDKKIEYSALTEQIINIDTLLKNGEKASYEIYPKHIEVKENGEYDLKYCYAPSLENDGIGDSELPVSGGRITPWIIGVGAAAEYCLIEGRFEEAVAFDEIFKDALVSAIVDKGKTRVRERRWI